MERHDFSISAESNWDLTNTNLKNEKEDLTLDEFLQIGQVAQSLPEIQKEIEDNGSYGDKKRKKTFQEIVDAIQALKEGGCNPIIIGFKYKTSEDAGGHAVLPIDYEEYEDKTSIKVIDSQKPGQLQELEFYKKKEKYTGEWHYNDKYQYDSEKTNFITYSHPLEPFGEAYGKMNVQSAYILEIIVKNVQALEQIMFPGRNDIVKIDNIVYGNGMNRSESGKEYYWVLSETEIPIELDGAGDISIAGDTVEVQYNNLQTGTATVSMKEDNFTFTTDQSGQKDAEISYLFYNENNIKKVTIREPQQDSSLEVYNKDEKIYFKGLNSAEIKTETGDYDEKGDFIPDDTVVKTFSNLSEEEEYEVDGNEEIEHIVRVSDNVITGCSPDDKPLQNIQLSENDITLLEGESRILEVFYTPDDTADDKTIVWTSSDETVATVDGNGKISALNPGKTVITALVGNASAVCNITVRESEKPEETEKPVSTESPSQPTPTTEPEPTQNPEQPEPTETPASTETPEQPASTAEPTQTPEQPEPTGTPMPTDTPSQPTPTTGPKPTQTPEQPQPTATPASTDTPTQQKPLQSIAFEQQNITLQPEESCKLNIICNPVDTTDSRAADWTSSDESVASVNTEGTVTAHTEGTAQITAKIGENTAVCTVTVKASGQESGADGENTNNSQENNSNTGEQPAEGQQEISALSSPKTGESDNWMIYVILTGCVVTGLATISALLRRKQEK